MKWYLVKKAFKDVEGKEHEPAPKGKRKLLQFDESVKEVKALVTDGTLEETELTNIEQASSDMREELTTAMKGIVEALVPAAIKEAATKLKLTAESPNGPVILVGVDRELQDPLLGFKSAGHFFHEVRDHSVRVKAGKPRSEAMDDYLGRIDKINNLPETKAYGGQNEGIGDEGEILAPAEVSNRIRERVFAPHTIMGDVDMYSLRGNSITFPRAKDSSRATGARHAGVTSAWLGGGAQLSFQKIGGLDELSLKLNKLGALTAVTSEMEEDGGGVIEQWVVKNVAAEIAFQVQLALWEGDGNKKPLGAFASGSKVLKTITRAEKDTVTAEDVAQMMSYCFVPSLLKGRWFCHQRLPWEHLMKMHHTAKDAADVPVGGWPVFLPPNGLAESPGGILFGRPVVPHEFCQPPGTAGDIVYADFSEMVGVTKGGVGDVPAVNTAFSIHFLFDYDAKAIRSTYRIDAQPWQNKLITPFRDEASTTYATFLTLNTNT